MKQKILKIWKDPVWSKVISAGIITLVVFMYNFIKVTIAKGSFKQTLRGFWGQEFELWHYIFGLIFLATILILYFFIKKKTKEIVKSSFDDIDITTIHLTKDDNNDYKENNTEN